MEKDFEALIEKLDRGELSEVAPDLQKEYQLMLKGISYLEEEEFRLKLNAAHQKLNEGNNKKYWTIGIAASLAGLILLWTFFNNQSDSIEVQIDEVPAFADSASYDSLKNVKQPVDNIDE